MDRSSKATATQLNQIDQDLFSGPKGKGTKQSSSMWLNSLPPKTERPHPDFLWTHSQPELSHISKHCVGEP